jgi:rhamnosyltransferase subunit B
MYYPKLTPVHIEQSLALRVLISAVGSHGDTLPFVGLGRALRERGHDVCLYGNGLFTALVHDAGLHYVETSDAQLVRDALADRRAIQTRSGLSMIAQGVMPTVMPTLTAMARDVLLGETLLVGSSLAFAPRLLSEVQRLPLAAVHLSPSMFRSDYLAPRVSPLIHFERWPRTIKHATWALMDRCFLDPAFGVPLNEIRAGLGLPPIRRVFHEWIHQATVTVGMFPEWLAPRQPDWPAGLKLTGFPMYDGEQAATLSPELQAFIEAGPAPVVFTAGTANTTSESFYAESAQACRRLNLRGILVAGQRSQLPGNLPPDVVHVPYASFSQLLPRSAAVVHHGGIGTLSQAARAGIPQLIRPMAYDQFDNASRACRLGVATELLPRSYRGGRLDAALRGLTNKLSMQAACEQLSGRIKGQDGLREACEVLEGAVK